jgi:methanogenic corrinoid protein MtbC1
MSESEYKTNPVFNLSVVLNETGLKPDILRVWEKRYGLPKPSRSSGGHRLFSRLDIETVKWLQARQGEGLSIKHATDLWKELVADGQDPIGEYKRSKAFTPELSPIGGVQLDVMRNKWLEACLAFNRHQADAILNEAFALYPIEHICVEILLKGLSQIGERWYRGLITVQQEHFVSAQIMRRLEALINAAPDPTREQAILIGCPSGELHTFPSLFLSLMLRRRGYQVIDLGADIPFDQLQPTIAAIQPDLVLMIAQQLTTAAAILKVAHMLKQDDIPFAYGGLIFNRIPSLRTYIPAHFLGESLAGGLTKVESLLSGSQNLPVAQDTAVTRQAFTSHYQESRPRIESIMFDVMQKYNLSIDQIGEVNTYLGDRISAAMAFSDPDLIEPDLVWLVGLFSTRRLPLGPLTHYLDHYSEVLHMEVGEISEPIVLWMKTLVTKLKNGHQSIGWSDYE